MHHIYPHLTLQVTWLNVEPLVHFATKVRELSSAPPARARPTVSLFRGVVRSRQIRTETILYSRSPSLVCSRSDRRLTYCHLPSTTVAKLQYQIPSLLPVLTTFLTTHAPGRPIAALALAETLGLPDLFQEASRYVLDQLPNWPEDEYMALGGETRWKLEKRRGYFLDRVLKMGLIEVEKDYICVRSQVTGSISKRPPASSTRLTTRLLADTASVPHCRLHI